MKYIFISLLIILLLYLIITYIMFIFISKKMSKELPMSSNINKMLEPYKEVIDKGNNWINNKYKNHEIEDIYIKSNDNLKLHGIYIDNKNSKGIFIEIHGYRSSAERDLYASCYEYYKMGYSLLLIDNRTSNKSEGKYITFGMRESEDLINWIKYINKKHPKKKIILAGISMGATTILLSLNNIKKNMNIKTILVDSGYISAYEEVLYCIKHYFHIPGKLFINMINIYCILIGKFNLKEKNTLKSLSKSKIPILFIHSKEDDFVPTINSITMYEEYNGPKKLVLFDKATHGMSYLVDSDKYINSIKSFIKNKNN